MRWTEEKVLATTASSPPSSRAKPTFSRTFRKADVKKLLVFLLGVVVIYLAGSTLYLVRFMRKFKKGK